MKYQLSKAETNELKAIMENNDYEIMVSMPEFIKILNKYYYINSEEDVISNTLELYGAENIPYNWLDIDTMLSECDDYEKLGNDRYINIYRFTEDEDDWINENIIRKG